MTPLLRHVFVCINEREPGAAKGCCSSKGGSAVRDALKKELARHGLLSAVRANKAGCLDQCEVGVVMVVYPEQVWYAGVTVDDVPEIVEKHILGGEVVERLLIDGQREHLAASQLTPIRLPAKG